MGEMHSQLVVRKAADTGCRILAASGATIATAYTDASATKQLKGYRSESRFVRVALRFTTANPTNVTDYKVRLLGQHPGFTNNDGAGVLGQLVPIFDGSDVTAHYPTPATELTFATGGAGKTIEKTILVPLDRATGFTGGLWLQVKCVGGAPAVGDSWAADLIN